MDEDELLDNEQIEKILSPHPFSFMKFQSLCFFLIIWGLVVGWLVAFSPIHDTFSSSGEYPFLAIVLWGIVLLLIAVLASLITIQWNVFIFTLIVVLVGLLPVFIFDWHRHAALFVPLYSLTCAIIGFVLIEAYRRSHKYFITTFRIIYTEGVITKHECSLRYDKITAINTKQGILGRLLSFGTIIPTTGSEGEGSAAGRKKKKKANDEEKELLKSGMRNRYELRGVYPFKEAKKTIEKLVQETVITPYQKEQVEYHKQQVDIQKQMRDLLKKQVKTSKTEDDDEDDEDKSMRTKMITRRGIAGSKVKEEKFSDEEVFEPEHVDVQQQMKELLKKREKVSTEKEEEKRDDEQKEVA